MNHTDPLVAIIPKEAADRVIAGLKAEGCYDADRRIRQVSAAELAIPVSETPTETRDGRIEHDTDPAWRIRDLEDRLRLRGFSAEELQAVPQSWAVIGDVVTGRFTDCPREREVGEALLDIHGRAETVLSIDGITGEHRVPETRVIAGSGQTETVHVEDGTQYALDLNRVMFSPGNQAERIRMGSAVSEGERVFDMFAGIGYFTLPMARAGATVIATERNPTAYRYLQENIVRNEVNEDVSAYRLDCRALRPRVDRVVMGYYDASEYLHAAMPALRPGGVIHLHDVAPADDPFSEGESALHATAGGRPVDILDRRIVKTHSPGMVHVVIECTIGE